jgi:hypothetical protein
MAAVSWQTYRRPMSQIQPTGRLDLELDAVGALIEVRHALPLDTSDPVRILCRAIDHLLGGAPSIDWSLVARLADDALASAAPPLAAPLRHARETSLRAAA